MKKCFNFITWEEKKDMMIHLSKDYIVIEDVSDGLYSTPPDLFEILDEAYCLNMQEHVTVLRKSTDSDPIFQKYPLLLELEKKLGFEVYGDYVVLKTTETMLVGDFIISKEIKTDKLTLKESEDFRYNLMCSWGISGHLSVNHKHIFAQENIIEELSKYYRGEENKFNEFRKILETLDI